MARNDLSSIRALASREARDASELFFVEGERFVIAALTTRAVVEQLVIARGRRLSPTLAKLARHHPRVLAVEREAFESISTAAEPSGIGAVVRQRYAALPRAQESRPRKRGPWLCFESVQARGNLGSAIRSAAAFGAGGVVFLGDAIDPFDPGVVRATMGALFMLPLVRATPRELQRWRRRSRAPILGTSARGRRDVRGVELRGPGMLMIGHERSGMSDVQRDLCDEVVRIPISGRVDSLNLATATSLLLYETWWRGHGPPR